MSRSPVVHKGERVAGLWQRRTVDGRLRFESVTRIDGRKVVRVLAAETPTEAIRERHALLVELRSTSSSRAAPGSPVTFREARDAYVEHLELLAKTGERSERSASAASYRLRRFGELDELTLDAIGSPELAGAVRTLRRKGLAAWTLKTTLAAFSACWTFAATERGWTSLAARPAIPRVAITKANSRQARRLNEGQIADLVASATDAGRPLVALLAYTGLRLSEALAVRWSELDLVDGVLRVERQLGDDGRPTERLKAEASRRSVPVPPALEAVLTEHLAAAVELGRGDAADLVLMSARRTAYTKRRALVLFGKAATAAGLDGLRPHDCRHSYGSLLLDRSVPLPAVSRLLGHANVATTARVYAGVVEGREQATADLVAAAFGGRSGSHAVLTEPAEFSLEETENAE